ncbi:MAG: DHH family phosphoesterase [Deltaproteobacteria bacterium]|jgi:phosphoesterase RecJ-like protein|nr:DHH family phosphoesterase [Deltaproteobacteria bacterium]
MTPKQSYDPLLPDGPPEELLASLREAKRPLIIGHENPDGDALGSALALGLALQSPGRSISVGYSGTFSKCLEFLVKGKGILSYVPFSPELGKKHDLLVLVDCLDPFRVWVEAENCPPGSLPPHVCVDHHANHYPSHHLASYINHQAAATAELVFKVIEALGAEFTPSIVEALLAALISDTGSFSQGNATSECLRQASFLVSKGGDIENINHYLKRNWSQTRMRLLVATLGTIALHHGDRVATMLLTQETLNQTGSCLAEAEGLVDYPLLLQGVDLVAFFKVNGAGKTRVSLRGRPGVNVRDLADAMGGGGHRQASAYLDDSPDPAVAMARALPLLERLIVQENTN